MLIQNCRPSPTCRNTPSGGKRIAIRIRRTSTLASAAGHSPPRRQPPGRERVPARSPSASRAAPRRGSGWRPGGREGMARPRGVEERRGWRSRAGRRADAAPPGESLAGRGAPPGARRARLRPAPAERPGRRRPRRPPARPARPGADRLRERRRARPLHAAVLAPWALPARAPGPAGLRPPRPRALRVLGPRGLADPAAPPPAAALADGAGGKGAGDLRRPGALCDRAGGVRRGGPGRGPGPGPLERRGAVRGWPEPGPLVGLERREDGAGVPVLG